MRSRSIVLGALVALTLGFVIGPGPAAAQAQRAGAAPPVTRTARESAPIDLTGYWVPLITEDWRLRMFVPPKGDYTGVPLNPEGRKVADTWSPDAAETGESQCRNFGAPSIMRKPGRLHVVWQDDATLKLDFDVGTQTRLFSFGPVAAGKAGDWQGVSQASWEFMPATAYRIGDMSNLGAGRKDTQHGSLTVVTTKLKSGYLRTNGVPYSADAVLTEYFDVVRGPDGEAYLLVTSLLNDPTYLTQPFMTSTQWRKQPNAAGWSLAACAGG